MRYVASEVSLEQEQCMQGFSVLQAFNAMFCKLCLNNFIKSFDNSLRCWSRVY